MNMGQFSFLPQVQQKVNDVEVREKELFDWRKKVSEAECKLIQQENLLDCAVKERNLYSKNLIEAEVCAVSFHHPALECHVSSTHCCDYMHIVFILTKMVSTLLIKYVSLSLCKSQIILNNLPCNL